MGEPRVTSHARYVLGLLVVVYAFNFVDRQILAILLQAIKQDLQISDALLGLLSGPAFAIFYTLAGIPIARWADYGSRRSIIALGLTVWSAMTALCGLAGSFTHLLLARIGVGVGEAAGSPPAHSLIADYYPAKQRGRALAIYTLGANAGILFGLAAGGWLAQTWGWRSAFFLVGLPGILLAVVVRLTIREPERGQSEATPVRDEGQSVEEVFRYMWGLSSFRHLSIAMALYAFAGYGSTAWTPTYLIRIHQMPVAEVGVWLGIIIGIFGGAGTFIGGWLCDRLGERDVRWQMRVPAIGAVLQAPLVAAFLFWPSAPTALLAFLLPAMVVGSFYVGPSYAMTQSLAKLRMRALASAILLFIINIVGLGLGPWVIGLLSDALVGTFGDESLRWAMLVMVPTNLWGALHSLAATRHLKEELERASR